MPDLLRRRLIAALSGGGVIAFLPFRSLYDLLRPAASDDMLVSRLTAIFSNQVSAQAIGQRYLAGAAPEADIPRLITLLCGVEGRNRLATASDEQLRALFAERQREDFRHGRTVNVDGWMLSQTEARLCALSTFA